MKTQVQIDKMELSDIKDWQLSTLTRLTKIYFKEKQSEVFLSLYPKTTVNGDYFIDFIRFLVDNYYWDANIVNILDDIVRIPNDINILIAYYEKEHNPKYSPDITSWGKIDVYHEEAHCLSCKFYKKLGSRDEDLRLKYRGLEILLDDLYKEKNTPIIKYPPKYCTVCGSEMVRGLFDTFSCCNPDTCLYR